MGLHDRLLLASEVGDGTVKDLGGGLSVSKLKKGFLSCPPSPSLGFWGEAAWEDRACRSLGTEDPY